MNKTVIVREKKKEEFGFKHEVHIMVTFWSEWRVEFPKGRTPRSIIVLTFLSFSNNSYNTSGEYIKDRPRISI